MVDGPKSCKADQIGLSPLRRLTRTEYDNSIKDFLGVDLGLSDALQRGRAGRVVPRQLLHADPRVAVRAVRQRRRQRRLQDGRAAHPAASLRRGGSAGGDEGACATQFIRQFGRRAYRRPLADAEVGRYEALFKVARGNGDFATASRW